MAKKCGRFELSFVEREEGYNSQLEKDMDVLSATVIYMQEYYTNLFSGLDEVIKAVNDLNKSEEK